MYIQFLHEILYFLLVVLLVVAFFRPRFWLVLLSQVATLCVLSFILFSLCVCVFSPAFLQMPKGEKINTWYAPQNKMKQDKYLTHFCRGSIHALSH